MTTTANTARDASAALALALLLDTPLRTALAALEEIGNALLDPAKLDLNLPPAVRARVSFDSCAGLGQITDILLFDSDDNRLPDDAAQALLHAVLPDGPGAGIPVGKLLSGTILRLLDLRHDDWQEEEGSTGNADIRWSRGHDGIETHISGTIGYRSISVTEYPFWNEDGVQCPQERSDFYDDE